MLGRARSVPKPFAATTLLEGRTSANDFVTDPARWGRMTTQHEDDARFIQRLPYRRLDGFHLALEALALADEVAAALPRGYAPFADQLRRASQSALLQFGEGSARFTADQRAKLIGARAEAVEGAIATEGIQRLRLGKPEKLARLLGLFARLAAIMGGMLRR